MFGTAEARAIKVCILADVCQVPAQGVQVTLERRVVRVR